MWRRYSEQVNLTRMAFQRGIGNEFNVVLAERQLSAALSRVAPLGAAVRQSERQIAVLLGDSPQQLYAELDRAADSDDVYRSRSWHSPGPGATPPGRPRDRTATRRRHRPHRRCHRLSLPPGRFDRRMGIAGTGSWPVAGQEQHDLVGWPGVRAPILDFGRLDALVKVQDYQTQALLLVYRKTVASAVEEVEDALTNYAAQRNRMEQLTVAVASSQQAVNLATQRYNDGLTDFLNVLDAQRQLYDLEDQLATSQQAASTNLVALFKSLGGGWEGFGQLPPAPGRIRR